MIEDASPDYGVFCERFWDEDNDCPMYTEDEYKEFCTWWPAFIVGNRILEDEPPMGASKKYRVTPDSVVLESSFDDEYEDDDFDE